MSASHAVAAKSVPPAPALPPDGPVLFDVSPYAGRPVSAISSADLATLAKRAWNHAARKALAQGHSVTVKVDGELAEMTADGRLTHPYGTNEAAAPAP